MNHPQPFAGQGRANGHGQRQNSARHSGDFRSPSFSNGSGSGTPNGHAPMPVPPPRGPNMGNGGFNQGVVGARSPPGQKNTSHVPCKFFRQGTCQAGAACPFLHGEISQPCKYFQKGNCKFGLKCANDHITPDGRRVNKSTGYVMPGPLALGGRVMPAAGPPSANSLLTMQQDQFAQPQPIPGAPMLDPWRNADAEHPSNSAYNSLPKSQYGSPPAEQNHLLLSPQLRGLTAAQAQLPASFDSQGISKYARDGPFAASVPSRFGFDSSPPSSSIPRPTESSALRNLHSSAFGDDINNSNGKLGLPSSPPTEDGMLGRRILHSERYSSRNTNNRMLSASVGARPPVMVSRGPEDEWDDAFALEEEMVPNSLHDLLTPAEKARRFSRSAEDELRPSLSGIGTPNDSSSKVGSPSQHVSASPSRFGAFFAGRARENSDVASSPFGPVGSPLRNNGLHPNASPSLRATANARPLSGELGPGLSSPPRQASMSMISQQLQRTRLSEKVSEGQQAGSPLQHPGISRVASGSSAGSSPAPGSRLTVDRAVSSSSVGRDKIDEEPEELFSMDEISMRPSTNESNGTNENVWKRSSGGAWAQGNPFALGKASPRLGPIGGQRTQGNISRPSGGNAG